MAVLTLKYDALDLKNRSKFMRLENNGVERNMISSDIAGNWKGEEVLKKSDRFGPWLKLRKQGGLKQFERFRPWPFRRI